MKESEFNERFRDDFEREYQEIKTQVNELNLKDSIESLSNVSEISNITVNRNKLISKIFDIYRKYKVHEEFNQKLTDVILNFYQPYFEINPFEIDIPYFTTYFNGFIQGEKALLKGHAKDNEKLEGLFKKIEEINFNSMIDEKIKEISEEVNELTYSVPPESLYNFLLDFSNVIPDPNISKIEGSTEDNYSLKSSMGVLKFKIIDKEIGKKIVYEYDFLNTTWGEKGRLLLNFEEKDPGTVLLKAKNEIMEISQTNRDNKSILNALGTYLKTYIDLNIGKVVAKQVQTIFYEKSFDDLTMGNYRILQAKITTMGKNIENLKNKFFEVKAPLSLTSFDCSECGATLNITSNEEKFIICEHCDTPFLMEWQRNISNLKKRN